MFRRTVPSVVCLAMLSCFIGCPGGPAGDFPDTVQVTGTVTYNGTAVGDATVTFAPSSGTNAAIGTTNAQGFFSLKSHWGADGAVPGSYKVTVTKTEVNLDESGGGEAIEEGEEVPMMIEEPGMEKEGEIKEHLPAKYAVPSTSDLTAEVKAAGGNDFKFELTD